MNTCAVVGTRETLAIAVEGRKNALTQATGLKISSHAYTSIWEGVQASAGLGGHSGMEIVLYISAQSLW